MNEEQKTTASPCIVELPDVAMLEAAQLFIAQVADATKQPFAAKPPGQPAAASQPAAANVVGQPAAASQPACGQGCEPVQGNKGITVGDTGIGKSFKHKEKYNDKTGQVLALLSNHVRVKLLEGPAKDEEHKYFYKDFTATTLLPPLPPPINPPASEVATEPAAAAAVNQAPSLPVTESQVEVDAIMDVFDQ